MRPACERFFAAMPTMGGEGATGNVTGKDAPSIPNGFSTGRMSCFGTDERLNRRERTIAASVSAFERRVTKHTRGNR